LKDDFTNMEIKFVKYTLKYSKN